MVCTNLALARTPFQSATHRSVFLLHFCPSHILQSLLSRALLNGNLTESNPCALLQRLNNILSVVLEKASDVQTSAELWSDILFQCSHTHCTGHALLLALLSQKYTTSTTTTSSQEPRPAEVRVQLLNLNLTVLHSPKMTRDNTFKLILFVMYMYKHFTL